MLSANVLYVFDVLRSQIFLGYRIVGVQVNLQEKKSWLVVVAMCR